VSHFQFQRFPTVAGLNYFTGPHSKARGNGPTVVASLCVLANIRKLEKHLLLATEFSKVCINSSSYLKLNIHIDLRSQNHAQSIIRMNGISNNLL
jgi:hypothetical protein